MLNIDEKALQLFLEKKKEKIEKKRPDGLGEIISSFSLMITLILADFSYISSILSKIFILSAWFISIVILLFGIRELVRSLICNYSVNQLYEEIKEIDPKTKHPFNIVLIKNEEGCYLVFWNTRWKCWLFPNYHCIGESFDIEKEKDYVDACLIRDLKEVEKFNINYLGNKQSTKYSVGDKIDKNYIYDVGVKSPVIES